MESITDKKSIQGDIKMGTLNECKVIDYLNEDLIDSQKFKLSEYDFSIFDFENTEYICELKSRRNNYRQYPTTMVGYNKIKKAQKTKKKIKFFFLFTDGLYCWDYNANEYEIRMGGRTDRRRKEIKKYAFISIEFLKPVNLELTSL